MIGDALCSVPNIEPSEFEDMLNERLQDMLVLVYLGKLTRAQLSIADKINQILHATIPKYDGLGVSSSKPNPATAVKR